MARRTGRVHAGKEVQLHHDKAFALACLASSFGDIERKTSAVVMPLLRCRRRSKNFANVVEQTGVGRQIRAGRSTNGLLIHADQSPYLIEPRYDFAFLRLLLI